MSLRPYQERAIADLRASYQRGKRRPCLVLPTGAGKTVVAAEIIRSATGRGNRVLFLAHRYELLRQTVSKLALAGVHNVRTIQADNDLGDPLAPVTVASVQTLTGRLDRLPCADLIVCDEAHHFVARTFARIVAAYPDARLLGLTATPQRGDGEPLGDVFDDLVVGTSIKDLTAMGHLVPCTTYGPPYRLETKQIATSPADAYARWGEGKRAVVFAASVAHAELIASTIPGAVVVHGQMPLAQRTAILASRPRVLVNCFVLSEGWDDPEVEVCILTRSPGHASTFLQMVGRVLRPHPGKASATLIDLAGTVHEHGTPEADRWYTLDGKGIVVEAQNLKQCPACGSVYAGARCGCGFVARQDPKIPTDVGCVIGELPPLPPRAMRSIEIVAKYSSRCRVCGIRIRVGDPILWRQGAKPCHSVCG